jgi:hypothetical protein
MATGALKRDEAMSAATLFRSRARSPAVRSVRGERPCGLYLLPAHSQAARGCRRHHAGSVPARRFITDGATERKPRSRLVDQRCSELLPICPLVVTRPMFPPRPSVNQRLPSGPVVCRPGYHHRAEKTPSPRRRRHARHAIASHLGDPHIAIRPDGGAERRARAGSCRERALCERPVVFRCPDRSIRARH